VKIKILLFTFFVPLVIGILLLVKIAAPEFILVRYLPVSWITGAFTGVTVAAALFGKWKYLVSVSRTDGETTIRYYNHVAAARELNLEKGSIQSVGLDNKDFEKKKFGTITIGTADGKTIKFNVIGEAMKEAEKLTTDS